MKGGSRGSPSFVFLGLESVCHAPLVDERVMERKRKMRDENLCAKATVALIDLIKCGTREGELESTAMAIATIGLECLF